MVNFKTWEYDGEYAIRGYLYLLLYAVPGKLLLTLFGWMFSERTMFGKGLRNLEFVCFWVI